MIRLPFDLTSPRFRLKQIAVKVSSHILHREIKMHPLWSFVMGLLIPSAVCLILHARLSFIKKAIQSEHDTVLIGRVEYRIKVLNKRVLKT